MIDRRKSNVRVEMEVILIWLENLAKKESLSNRDREVIFNVSDYILKVGV